mgnify:CR=1 FL=1
MQASAHFWQASAQALQQSMLCLPHSAAQASQHFTQRAQSASENCESRAHKRAQRAQMSAQSRQTLTQASWPGIVQHIVAHFSHSTMQAKQASCKFYYFSSSKRVSCERNFTLKGQCVAPASLCTILADCCMIHTFSGHHQEHGRAHLNHHLRPERRQNLWTPIFSRSNPFCTSGICRPFCP